MARTLATLSALIALGSPLAAQEAATEATIEVVTLTDSVHMLVGQGGNLGVSVGPDGVFLIDDQFAPLHEAIVAAIDGLAAKPATNDRVFLLNTHFHPDHTGGNELLGDTGAVIVAHENVRTRLSVEQVVPFFDMRMPALQSQGLPVLTFTRDVTLHLNGEEIRIRHVGGPAHTDGDSFVHFPAANVLHTGDIVFLGTYPFIDLDNGGSVAGVIDAVELMIDLIDDETKVIPGHGPLTDKASLIAYRDMLQTVTARVRELVAAGKTLEEVQAARPTSDFDAELSTFVSGEAFTGLLYREAADD
jgi:cyclase